MLRVNAPEPFISDPYTGPTVTVEEINRYIEAIADLDAYEAWGGDDEC